LRHVTLAISIFLSLTVPAFAQFAGQLSTPGTMDNGASLGGLYAGIYEDAIGVLGQYRYGVGGYTDIGFKLGLLDLDNWLGSDAGIDFAFDVKYQVMERRLRDPFDLSIAGGTEFLFAEDMNIISFGLSPIGSYPVKLRNGRILEPYGRLQIRIERTHLDHVIVNGIQRGSDDDTDLELGLNLGTAFELSKSTRAIGELQFDEQFGFMFGAEFGF
jgi:hypothetical protein